MPPKQATGAILVVELKQLHYFVRIAEMSSVVQAAEILNVAQPTLSRQLQFLESELKVKLFHRNGRGVQLTAAGHQFLNQARGLLRSASSAIQEMRGGDSQFDGHIALGLTPSIGRLVLTPFIKKFVEQFPNASLTVLDGLSTTLQEKVMTGRLDFALLHNPVVSSEIIIDTLVTEPLYLIGHKATNQRGSIVPLQKLPTLKMILPSAPRSIRGVVDSALARLGLQLNVKLEVDSVMSIVELVENGYGHSIMPKNAMRVVDRSAKIHWQKIGRPQLTSTLGLVASSNQPRTVMRIKVAELMREVMMESLSVRVSKAR